jgi:phage gp45-like
MHTTSKTLSIFVLLAASTALTLDASTVSAASSTHAHHHHIQLMNSFTKSTSIVGINGIMSGDGGSSTTQHGSSNSHAHHHHGSTNSIADINWYQLGN